MILELEIQGFALVDHLVLEFESGLTVLTGETGAGKSVILDSLSFLLGGPPSGSNEGQLCRVAGRFVPTGRVNDYLRDQGLPSSEGEVLVMRERKPGGRTTSRLNGSLVTASQLKSLCDLLLDFHGQHQSYGLTRPATHLPMLDKLAGAEQTEELESYGEVYRRRSELQSAIDELQSSESQRLREIEWLKLELEEIREVAPRPEEDLELESEIRRRAAAEDLAEGVGAAIRALSTDALNEAVGHLRGLPRFDDTLGEPLERLAAAEIEVTEVTRTLVDYAEQLEHNPAELDRLQQRAEALKRLKRKYGPTLEDVTRHLEEGQERLERLQHKDRHVERLQAEMSRVETELRTVAGRLSGRRLKAARALKAEVVRELSELAMPSVSFEVDFQELDPLGPQGAETAQFLFSPNPGRLATPLAETASGGELSRVMLALVSILSRFQRQPTIIFDEIDAGLGGRTAEAVAQKLANLAQRAQLLCVTHLPVVAAAGQSHFVVEKSSDGEQTQVTVQKVEKADRVAEVARMLSGDSAQKKAQRLAKDLLRR